MTLTMTPTFLESAITIIESKMIVAYRTRDGELWSRCLAAVDAIRDAGTIYDEATQDALDLAEDEKFLTLRRVGQAHVRWVRAVNAAIEALSSGEQRS